MASRSEHFADTGESRTDEECIRQTLQGKTACFEQLVARYSARLLRFAYCRVRSVQDAEDICQETFLKAYRSLHTFDVRNSFKTWLFSITFHETVSFLRKKKVPTCSDLPEIAGRQQTEDSTLFTWEEIWTAARCLPPDQYTLLWLKYKENLSIGEIAAITGKSRIYTRVLLHRARKKLSEILSPSPEEENSGLAPKSTIEVSCSMRGESNVL